MFLVASLHVAFSHFGTQETLGCSRFDKSQVQKVKFTRAETLLIQEKLH